jgi:hypothetical protein
MIKVDQFKQHLKEIWTSWRIGEEGLEEEALNGLLKHFKTERHGISNACVCLACLPEI